MILRKEDLQGEPCWRLRQWCPCGEVVGYTITMPLGIAKNCRLSWRSMAARRIMSARREIREHIARDQRKARQIETCPRCKGYGTEPRPYVGLDAILVGEEGRTCHRCGGAGVVLAAMAT